MIFEHTGSERTGLQMKSHGIRPRMKSHVLHTEIRRFHNVRRRDILKELEWVGPSRPTIPWFYQTINSDSDQHVPADVSFFQDILPKCLL